MKHKGIFLMTSAFAVACLVFTMSLSLYFLPDYTKEIMITICSCLLVLLAFAGLIILYWNALDKIRELEEKYVKLTSGLSTGSEELAELHSRLLETKRTYDNLNDEASNLRRCLYAETRVKFLEEMIEKLK